MGPGQAMVPEQGLSAGPVSYTHLVFGGEGIFNTIITGPGHVYLQTMPISQVAGVLRPFMPTAK